MNQATLDTRQLEVSGDLTLGYRDQGAGPPVLLLHGWPTSSFLWRNVMPALAGSNRALAIDLPGFGSSSKPTDRRYDFALFEDAIERFLEVLGVDEVAVVGHDLGGPIAVHWALRNPSRVTRLGLLNTLLYPEFSDAVIDFVTMLIDPARRGTLTSESGLAELMRLGVRDESVITDDVLDAITAPFATADDRLALAFAGIGLPLRGFVQIAAGLPTLTMPVRAVYGTEDRVLPGVGETMARLQRDVPHAEIIAVAGAGHFLQEERPEQVGRLLGEFLRDC